MKRSLKSPLACFVGLTGDIGTGKSTVRQLLAQKGVASLDTDSMAKNLLFAPEVQARLIPALGAKAFVDGIPQKEYIAQIIFGNPHIKQVVEGIIHPSVWEKVHEVTSCVFGIVVIESALLRSIVIPAAIKLIVEVTCSPEDQLRRLMEFRKMTKVDALARIHHQQTKTLLRPAHIEVNTSCSLSELNEKITKLYKLMLRYYQDQTQHTKGIVKI